MTPGTPEIIRCPSCEYLQQRETLRSGNTFGAKFYSDGKCEAPMLPQFPHFVKCPECKSFFKIAPDVVVEKNQTRKPNIPFVSFLTTDEYLQAISSGLLNGNENDILSLRIELWRTYNDAVRDGQNELAEKELYEDNCRKILSSATNEPNDDEMCLMCAEMWRNIGEFDKSKALLNEIKSPDKYIKYISVIDSMCDVQNTLTVCVNL